MMGSAAAFDMARTPQVSSVTLADSDAKRARDVATRVNRITGDRKVRAVVLDASDEKAAAKLMQGHSAALSAVPYFLNLGLARAAVEARCHFADLGGNNTVVRQELALSKKAEKRGVALAPDCGLSPGMASILGGELVRRLGGRADALRLYVGGLPEQPTPPFHYQLVFSGGRFDQRICGAGAHLEEREVDDDRSSDRTGGFPHCRVLTAGGVSHL
jgi:lysine 6-dehydrogenase